MKKLHKSIISAFLAIAIAISLSAPAYAIDWGTVVNGMKAVPDFGSWMWSTAKTAGNLFAGFWDIDNYCPGAGDSLNGRHNFVEQHTQVNGKAGYFYICENCGLSAGEAFESAYNDYVTGIQDSIGTTVINQNGLPRIYLTGWTYSYSAMSSFKFLESFSEYPCISFSAENSYNYQDIFFLTILTVPISGTFRIVFPKYEGSSGLLSGYAHSINLKNNAGGSSTVLGDIGTGFTKSVFLSEGNEYQIYSSGVYLAGKDGLLWFRIYRPYLELVSASGSYPTYNTTTRPTSITGGNYGIIGDDGQLTVVNDNSTIINETNNTYYNPATGATGNITSWTYDYSDRSYNVTLQSGDTVTVTYGDEYITIQEGDTIYNVYYIIPLSITRRGAGRGGPIPPGF